MSAPRFSLIVPTFNESENLPILVERVAAALGAAAYEIVVVDDDSPDGTWKLAESLRSRYPQLRVIRRTTGEKGLAPAVVEGWRSARGEVLGVIDADLQHPPEVLPRVLAPFDDPGVDVVIASRYTASAQKLKWNLIRKWISRGASNLAQAVLPARAHQVTDPMSGFFLLRRSVIEGLEIQPKGYKILLEVLSRGSYRRVAEVPYVFGKREHGQSKLGAQVMRDYLAQLWNLAWSPQGFGRFLRYCLVGATGVVVNFAVLALLRHYRLGMLRAPAVAIECAILNNFLWNEFWTFRDRSQLAPQLLRRLKRLVNFNLICATGAAIHLGIMWALAIEGHWHYWGVNLLAIALATIWNYGLNTSWTWAKLSPAGAPAAAAASRASS